MRWLSFLLLFTAVACSSGDGQQTAADTTAQQTNEIVITAGTISTLSCKLNVVNTYDVYLPKTHTAEGNYPVLIFFSPEGKGRMPLEKYQSLADEWEFILIGSN